MREMAMPHDWDARALRWAKFDIWFNFGAILLYVGVITFQAYSFVNGNSPWGWVAVLIDVAVMSYFGYRLRKAFKQYIEMKGRSDA